MVRFGRINIARKIADHRIIYGSQHPLNKPCFSPGWWHAYKQNILNNFDTFPAFYFTFYGSLVVAFFGVSMMVYNEYFSTKQPNEGRLRWRQRTGPNAEYVWATNYLNDTHHDLPYDKLNIVGDTKRFNF